MAGLTDKAVLTQGSSMKTGLSPLGCETLLWTAAVVAREVVLVCPVGLEMEELESYFYALIVYLVSENASRDDI